MRASGGLEIYHNNIIYSVGMCWVFDSNGLRLDRPVGRTPNLAQFHRSREILAWAGRHRPVLRPMSTCSLQPKSKDPL